MGKKIYDEFGFYREGEGVARIFLESFTVEEGEMKERDVSRFIKDNLETLLAVPHGKLSHEKKFLSQDEIVLVEEIASLHGLVHQQDIELEDLKVEGVF